MRNIVVWPFSFHFAKNEMFNINSQYNNENRLSAYVLLYNRLREKGFRVATYDMFDFDEIGKDDIYLSFDHSQDIFKAIAKKIEFSHRILIVKEPLNEDNFLESNREKYAKILTWNDSMVDGKQIEKIAPCPITRVDLEWVPLEKRKFLTGVFSNKASNCLGELYSQRPKTFRVAERLFQDRFEFYGIGWNKPKTLLQKLKIKPYQSFVSYEGAVKDKYAVLKEFIFTLCYENRSMLGHISEQIFDCFQCGVIPLYWGAPNVLDYIPQETFIWREDFKSNEEMLLYIKNMTRAEITEKIENIRNFLNSDAMNLFWEETYVSRIIDAIGSI